MDIFEQPCYKTTKNLATVSGRWPYQIRKQSLIMISVFWIGLGLQAVPQIIALVVYFNDREILFEGLPPFLIDCILAAKYLNASYHAELIRILFDKVQSDWKLLTSEEKCILQYHSDVGRFLSRGYTVFFGTSTTIFAIEPIMPRIYSFFLRSNESFPNRFALPVEYLLFNKDDHYYLMLSITSLFIFTIGFGFISCDILFITLLQHICGLFAVLGYRIEQTPEITVNYSEKEVYTKSTPNNDNLYYQHLISCIKMHTRALQFADLLEECFAISFGVVVVVNLPLISVTGLQITTPEFNTVQQILKCVAILGAGMVHLFFDCYMSQKLNDSSSKIAHSIASIEWYNKPIKSQKLLVIMTMRSQVPCKLTAGKIIELSIESYATLKTAGSYFTMLVSLQ